MPSSNSYKLERAPKSGLMQSLVLTQLEGHKGQNLLLLWVLLNRTFGGFGARYWLYLQTDPSSLFLTQREGHHRTFCSTESL